MDRPHRLRFTSLAAVSVLFVLVGCATIPDNDTPSSVQTAVPSAREDNGQPPAEDSGGPGTSEAGADLGDLPDISFPSAEVVRPTRTEAGVPALFPIGGEFHLSEDTGWLILPLPRFADDLPPLQPASLTDEDSGFVLILPVPRGAGRHSLGESPAPETASGAVAEDATVAVIADEESARVQGEGTGVSIAGTDGRAAYRTPAAPEPVASGPPPVDSVVSLPVASDPASEPVRAGVPSRPLGTGTAVVGNLESEPTVVSRIPPIRETERRVAADWVSRYESASPVSELVVTLPGTGWLYVGRESGVGEADLIGKRSLLGDDEFVFRFSEGGEYGLWFQRQDPVTGEITNERLGVTAASVAETPPPATSVAATHVAATAGGTAEPLRAGAADRAVVPGADDVEDAMSISDDPSMWMETAEAAMRSGNGPVAAEYFSRVSSAGGVDAAAARRGLFDLAMTSVDARELSLAVDELRSAGELTEENLRHAANAAADAELYELSVSLYEELVSSGAEVAGLDEIYFRMAQLLEKPGPGRDLRRSLVLYDTVVLRFPLSSHWDDSSARIEYLKRHYFEIR